MNFVLCCLFCSAKATKKLCCIFQNQCGGIAVLPGWEQGGVVAGRPGGLDLLAPFFSSVPCVSIHWFAGSIGAAGKTGVGTCGQE